MTDKRNLKRRLKKDICLSDIVEEKVQNAYSQIYAQEKVKYISHPKKRKIMIAVALGTAILGIAITGVAASVYFAKNVDYTDDTLTYKFDIDYELIPGEYEVRLDYIPDGFVDTENGKTSYTNPQEDDMSFTILPIMNTVELDNQSSIQQDMDVENVEHTVLSSMEADVITYKEKDKYERPTRIYLFNPQEGYVVWVHGSYQMPVDELKKVADHLTVTRIGDSEERYLTEAEKEELEKDEQIQKQKEKEFREKGIQDEQIIPLGESFSYPTVGYNGTTEENISSDPVIKTFTIQDVEIFEKLKDFDENTIYEYEKRLAQWLNEDGSLKSYTRQMYDMNGTLLKEETVGQLFMKVKVQVKCESNEEFVGIFDEYFESIELDARLTRLGEKKDGYYEYAQDYYETVPSEHNDLGTDGSPIGFSKPQYSETDRKFFWRTIDVGEVLEYELLFVIDEDLMEENVVLSFWASGNSGTIYPDSLNGVYHALKVNASK